MLRVVNMARDAESTSVLKAIPKGIVLYGPAKGKAEIARMIAIEANLRFVTASVDDVQSDFVGQAGHGVRELFLRARANAPCILFIRDLDTFAPRRSSPKTKSSSTEIISQWLVEQDGLRRENDERFLFLLATTDCLEDVDQAVLSRLQTVEITP
jgi:transitional endoplasmic reticulum ATPase